MKIFISHSSKDANLALVLSSFLESINSNIDVFCSSQTGQIRIGRDFVQEITKELADCDIFVPLFTNNYYTSRFCMIELGFAYSYLYNKSTKHEESYIYPLAVPPVKKAEALMNTPLARLQVCSINDPNDIKAYVEAVCEANNMRYEAGLNRKISGFIYDVNKIILNKYDIFNNAKILLCKADNVPGEDQDYLNYSINTNNRGYTVNFRAKPFENSKEYPNFLSFVFKYIDKLDLYTLVNIYDDAKLHIQINNYTNSIDKIDIEIKYSDTNIILHKQTTSLNDGTNDIYIALNSIKSEALKQISEICLVIKPSSYIEDEGMYQITEFNILSSGNSI